jgi:GT2 family glycosyltransferase
MGFLPYCIGANMGVSMRAMLTVGGYTETDVICDDVDISFRLQLAGYTIYDQLDAIVHMRYRDTLKGLLRQHYNYAFSHTFLYKKFREHGMKKRRKFNILKGYFEILYDFCRWPMRTTKQKQLCLRSAAAHLGRVSGSIAHRVLYL